MKKSLCLLTAFVLLLSLAACGPLSPEPTTEPTANPEEFAANTCPCSVMVNGHTFTTFFQKADVDPDTIQPAGTITRASCSISAMPQENDTSNFETCVGQPYAWVDGDLILYCNNRWNICYWYGQNGQDYRLIVNGVSYYVYAKPGPVPTEDQIAGTIRTCTEGFWIDPTEEGQTNCEELVGQPYAWVNGGLYLSIDGSWYTCKPSSESGPSETQSTEAPTTAPTTAPTEPSEPETPWLLTDRTVPSYDDFFAQNRSYGTCASCEWLTDSGTVYSLRHDMSGLYITKNYWDAEYRIPNTEDLYDLTIIGADGQWGYLLAPNGILRLDLLTGETALLIETSTILQAELKGWDVLYYSAAAADGTVGIYRLYLPEMLRETLHEGIPRGYNFEVYFPSSTLGTVRWFSIHPRMSQQVIEELNNPDSIYKQGTEQVSAPVHLWQDTAFLQDPSIPWGNDILWLCRWIQEDTGIHTWYQCTYDSIAGTLTEDTGVIDNCWFGSGYAHDHFEPEITELPDPVPAPGEWVQISDAALPASPTAAELYAEGVYDHYHADIPELTIHGNPLEPHYLHARTEYTLTRLSDIPVTLAANSVHFIYCVTEDGRVLQLTHDGTVLNTLYTARGEIRAIDQANGHLYILDGDTLIDLDIPAMQYRVLLEQTDIIDIQAWEKPGQIYFCIARGLHYQQYIYHTDTNELERTFIL